MRDNVIYANDKAGLGFGGYAAFTGRVRDCTFTNNTLYKNDTLGAGFGELWIQYAEDNVVRNNLFYATGQNKLLVSEYGNVNTMLDYNLWYTDAGAARGALLVERHALRRLRRVPGRAPDRTPPPSFAEPAAGRAGERRLPPRRRLARDQRRRSRLHARRPARSTSTAAPRVNGPRVDCGADEATSCGNGTTELPELCDDGDLDRRRRLRLQLHADRLRQRHRDRRRAMRRRQHRRRRLLRRDVPARGRRHGLRRRQPLHHHRRLRAPAPAAATKSPTRSAGRRSAASCRSRIARSTRHPDKGNQLSWQWKKGAATDRRRPRQRARQRDPLRPLRLRSERRRLGVARAPPHSRAAAPATASRAGRPAATAPSSTATRTRRPTASRRPLSVPAPPASRRSR